MTLAKHLSVVLSIPVALMVAVQPPLEPRQNGTQPVVSPDGRRIAFNSNRNGTPDVYVMDVNGTEVTRLTSDQDNESRASWSADGKHVFFSVTKQDTARVFASSLSGARTELGRVAARGGAIPFKDGKNILAGVGPWTEMRLVVSGLDGSSPQSITRDHAAYWCASVSPRDDRIAAARKDSAGMQVWVMNRDGANAHAVTRFTSGQGQPQCPSWSPDGLRLAVQSAVPDARDTTRSVGHVWIIELATGEARKLAEHAAPYLDELPTWFPDGQRLAFQSDRSGNWEVWVMNVDGTHAAQLTR